MQIALITVMICVAAYALLAKRLSSTIITAPIIFLGLGFGLDFCGLVSLNEGREILHIVAEATLIIVLFADASMTDLGALKRGHIWPQRMLLIGLPLAVAFGTLVAAMAFPSWPLLAVALVASILAPTDAALGQAVVSNQAVPNDERRTLVVESGLNDGLALPVVLFFACALATIEGEHDGNFLIFTLQQLLLGPLVGLAVGWIGGKALLLAERKSFTESHYQSIVAIAIAVLAYILASMVDGNGFIAVFSAGLIFGNTLKEKAEPVHQLLESEGQILIWISFLLIGLVLLPNALSQLSQPMFLLILTSLFVVRPLAIWLSLIGTNTPPLTRLFFGWFGPRGLATALFALLVVGDINQAFANSVLTIAINAVWISAILHGISAAPGSSWYAKHISKTS